MLETLKQIVPEPHKCAAFLVKNKTVVYVNETAEQRQVFVGTKIQNLICSGWEDYEAFSAGELEVSIFVGGIRYTATVTVKGEHHLFCLSNGYAHPELKSLSLAGSYLNRSLHESMMLSKLLSQSRDGDPADVAKTASALNRQLFQMVRIIRNMTDAGTFNSLRAESMRYQDLSEILDPIGRKLAAYGQVLSRNIHYSGLNRQVFTIADQDALERAFYNMFSNAVQYSPIGSDIFIKATVKGNQLMINIQNERLPDSLPPMDYWDRFLREPGLDDHGHGIGLGLTVVGNVAKLHKGTFLIMPTDENRVNAAMTIAICSYDEYRLRSHFNFDVIQSGGYNRDLVELSELLPDEMYENI